MVVKSDYLDSSRLSVSLDQAGYPPHQQGCVSISSQSSLVDHHYILYTEEGLWSYARIWDTDVSVSRCINSNMSNIYVLNVT